MRLTKSNSTCRGQVSLESLILWAALFSLLAALLPVFAQFLTAQEALVEKTRAVELGSLLESSILSLTFSSPGSTMRIPIVFS